MNFNKKRHAKKMAKIFFGLGYVSLIVWGIIMIGVIINLFTITEEFTGSGNLIFIIIILIILCLIFGFIGQLFINKRIVYKEKISLYRQNTFFTKIIKLIMSDDKDAHKNAIHFYNCVDNDSALRKFLFSFIVTSSYYSNDKKVTERGKIHLMDILKTYDPEKIDF